MMEDTAKTAALYNAETEKIGAEEFSTIFNQLAASPSPIIVRHAIADEGNRNNKLDWK
jgi:hypothetical protein